MATRPRARRVPIREVLKTAIALEKKTMELYVSFVHRFSRPEEVRNFWFGMARLEAGHVGALALVESIIKTDPERAQDTRVPFDQATITRLRALLRAYLREAQQDVSLARALEMAVDIEASELEDLVVDMLRVVRSAGWRERAIQMLIHDLGDLSYMVERHTQDEELLRRADALIEHRRGLSGRRPRSGTRATRPTSRRRS